MSQKLLLYVLHFFSKGWQVSLLILLPFIQQEFGISLWDIGVISMVMSVCSIGAALVAGKVSERIGNKQVVVVSISCYVLAWLLFFFVRNQLMLWPIFALGGISAGLFDPIASALIARIAKDEHRGKDLGDYAAAGDLGRVGITTLTTLLIGFTSWQTVTFLFFACSLLLLGAFLVIHAMYKEVHIKEEKQPSTKALHHLFREKKFVTALLTGLCDSFSSPSLFIFLPFLLLPKGIEIAETGFLTSLFFFGYFSGRMLLGRFADKHGKVKVLIIAEVTMALLIVSLVFLTNFWLIVVNLFLLGVVTRGTSPIIKAMIADGLTKEDFENGYSVYSASVRTANSLSRPTFGFVGSMFGVPSIFYLSGVVALLTLVPALKFYKAK